VAARRPRIQVDRAEHQQVVDRFLAALRTGDLQVLLDVLAPDVVLVADGGGEVAAVRRPVVGRDRVATLLSRFRTILPDAVVGTVWLNGAPAGRIDLAGEIDTAISLVIADGRIIRIYAIRNPHKLARLDEEPRSAADRRRRRPGWSGGQPFFDVTRPRACCDGDYYADNAGLAMGRRHRGEACSSDPTAPR
jgi:hypothetical protein